MSYDEVSAEELRFLDEIISNISGDDGEESNESNSQTSVSLSSIMILKSMLGVGLLGIPEVTKNFGVLVTVLILLFVFWSSHFTTSLLLESKNMSRHSNFTTIGYYIFKTKWIIRLICLIIVLCNIGTCLSELIVFGTTCQNLISLYYPDDVPIYLQREFLLVLIGLLLLPFVIAKSIDKLQVVGIAGVFSIIIFLCIVIYNFIISYQNTGFANGFEILPSDFNFKSAFASLPTVILASDWQFNMFSIYKGMSDSSDYKMKKASIYGNTAGFFLFSAVGILGFATYGKNIETNYLITIQQQQLGDVAYFIINLSFTVSTVLSVPILFFSSRNSFIVLCQSFRKNKVYTELDSKSQKRIYYEFIAYSLSLFFILMLMALYLTELEVIFNLLGALCDNSIMTVLPTLFYFKLASSIGIIDMKTKLVKMYFFASLGIVIVCIGSELVNLSE